jgi:hypothetical protein
MKKIVILAIMCLLLVSCSLPFTINWKTATPELLGTPEIQLPTVAPQETQAEPTIVPTTALAFEGTEYNLGGVYMVVPECLAATPSGVIVPAVPYDEMNGPMEYYPEHRKITFEQYPLADKFFDPMIRIYPAAEFAAMNSVIADRISAMQTLLTSTPANPDGIPLLPMFNAAQVFRARVGYFPFQNGSGVRFLTEYAQYYAPVNNYDLFYSYQGLTADGKYWVSAIFPVNLPWLQVTWNSTEVPVDGVPAPAMDSANLQADMETYYATMLDRLNGESGEAFTPSVNCLDQFMQSLSIGD